MPPKRKRPFVERRGDRWRVRWPTPPDGKLASASYDDDGKPFKDDAAAESYGWAQLRKIGAGEWRDPNQTGLILSEWINLWWPAQDLSRRTKGNYTWFIEAFILPRFGDRELTIEEGTGLTTLEITAWELEIRNDGYDATTASKARSILITILNDAVVAGKLPANPAARPPRPRGRRSGRRQTGRSRNRAIATPLQSLLIAERMAILSRHELDFVLGVGIAWTGMRWAEAMGMEREFIRHDDDLGIPYYELESQLLEDRGRFYREPLKSDSYRTHEDDGISRVDLPPFLHGLLVWAGDVHTGTCRCDGACEGSGYIHLGPKRGHYRRNNLSARLFRPACDGFYPAQDRGRGKIPARPVLVDSTQWPGRVLQAWPAAVPSEPFTPPEVGYRKGRTRIPEETPLASWLPICRGLSPQRWRHSHSTLLEQARIPKVAREERMGHRIPGMDGRYTHVTATMRHDLIGALQEMWETALRERREFSDGSPVPILDKLLREAA